MQKVIAARDVDIFLNFDAIGVSFKLETGSSFTANISGNTEDIGAIGTDEPIATDNGGNTYDITLALQAAEAHDIKDALAVATASSADGSITHIRQIIETANIQVAWHRKRDIPASTIIETYSNCTGVSEADNVDRRASETIKNWNFRARGMGRVKIPFL